VSAGKRMKHMRVNRRKGEIIKLQHLLGKEDTALGERKDKTGTGLVAVL